MNTQLANALTAWGTIIVALIAALGVVGGLVAAWFKRSHDQDIASLLATVANKDTDAKLGEHNNRLDRQAQSIANLRERMGIAEVQLKGLESFERDVRSELGEIKDLLMKFLGGVRQ